MTVDIAEALRKGREWMEEHGWIRGQLHNTQTDETCGYGGILMGLGWLDQYNEAYPKHEEELRDTMRLLVEKGCGLDPREFDIVHINPNMAFIQWNDLPGRTEQEVLDAFAKAEKVAEAGFDPDA
jgi:hypothetical protein